MQTILAECPVCHRQHALIYYHMKRKTVLAVICNRQPSIVHGKGGTVTCQDCTKFVSVTDEAKKYDGVALDIPHHYTPQAKRKEHLSQELQLIIMNVRDGEKVERQVEFSQADRDHHEAESLKLKIEQNILEQKKLTKEIERYAKRRLELENEERELRRKLREVWTEPLQLN